MPTTDAKITVSYLKNTLRAPNFPEKVARMLAGSFAVHQDEGEGNADFPVNVLNL